MLAATIDKYCYITARYLPPFFEHRYCIIYSKMEYCQTVEEIEHPAVREVIRFLKIDRGLEIHHDGDLPGPQRHGLELGVHRRSAARVARPDRDAWPASSSWRSRACTSNRRS